MDINLSLLNKRTKYLFYKKKIFWFFILLVLLFYKIKTTLFVVARKDIIQKGKLLNIYVFKL